MKNPLMLLFVLIVAGGILNYFISSPSITGKAREEMREAYVAYVRGETAATVNERKTSFNQALKLYSGLEQRYHPQFGNGKLYYNLANTYFQLEEYPWAILYYSRALELMPRDRKTMFNQKVAQEKLGVRTEEKKSILEQGFFLEYFSLPEKLQFFFLFALIALLFASLFLWREKPWTKKAAVLFVAIAGIVLLNLGYVHYLAPIKGVIVRSTDLRRDAGLQYAKVTEEPLLSGNKVEVLDVLKEGKWLKILTPEGHLGYIPAQAIRVI